MANFTPTGQIKIGRVPFDNSYKHTMTFANAEAQRAYMASAMEQNLSQGGYTYVRANNAIRVPYNAESLYTYNYCMYQNANYGNKWFYAFIVDINYLNEGTTELVLELDVLQTWYFDYTLVEGYVEREHVNDDTIGAHLNPEPEFPFNIKVKSRKFDQRMRDCWIIVQTNAYPHFDQTIKPTGTDAKTGGFYQRMYSGCKYYAFDPARTTHVDEDLHSIHGFLLNMNQAGGAESISNIFMFPKAMTPNVGGDDGVQENTSGMGNWAQDRNPKVVRPASLDGGYVPRNNKLFTYPYCYCMIDDNNGHYKEYRYELWNKLADGSMYYTVESAIDPNATVYVIPNGYNGVSSYNMSEAFTFPISPKCSWNYSSYQTWSAQNALGNTLNVAANAAMIAIPAAKGLNAAGKALGVAVKSSARNRTLPRIGMLAGGLVDEARAGMGTAGQASLGLGAAGLSNFIGEVSRQSKIPTTLKGDGSGNTLFAINEMGYSVSQMVIQREFAEILDDFFDMYGYQVDRVKIPNRTGRPSWNYVKMQNACHHGNVPSDDMSLINDIYNAGITFWHTADVGNYSRANK